MARKKTGTKKKRGRPAGKKKTSKRGPGRPPGSKTKKKRGPGRPKGSTTKKKRGPGRPKGSTSKKKGRGPGRPRKAAGGAESILDIMDGRTKTVTLVKIAHKASELLDERPKPEVDKIEKAMNEAEGLKEKYESALKLIGEEPPF